MVCNGFEIASGSIRNQLPEVMVKAFELTGKSQQEVEEHFAGKGYAQLKGDLAEATIEFLSPIQQRVKETTDDELDRLLERGRTKARTIAAATLADVYKRIGISR